MLGANAWTRTGNTFCIGTNGKGSCLSIALDGTVATQYNFFVGGVTYRNQPVPTTTADLNDMITRILSGILTSNYTTALSLGLPTGLAVNNALLTINQSVDWSLINIGTATGAVTLTAVGGHSVVGNNVVAIGTSARLRTKFSAASTAITYRLS